jgi:hypothetical protein
MFTLSIPNPFIPLPSHSLSPVEGTETEKEEDLFVFSDHGSAFRPHFHSFHQQLFPRGKIEFGPLVEL